jgi:hypothetical protein
MKGKSDTQQRVLATLDRATIQQFMLFPGYGRNGDRTQITILIERLLHKAVKKTLTAIRASRIGLESKRDALDHQCSKQDMKLGSCRVRKGKGKRHEKRRARGIRTTRICKIFFEGSEWCNFPLFLQSV